MTQTENKKRNEELFDEKEMLYSATMIYIKMCYQKRGEHLNRLNQNY